MQFLHIYTNLRIVIIFSTFNYRETRQEKSKRNSRIHRDLLSSHIRTALEADN